METTAEPSVKLTYQGVILSGARRRSRDANMNVSESEETSASTPPSRLISLTTLGSRTEDSIGKRARPLGTPASEPVQPAHKKPPQIDLGIDLRTAEIQASRARNQEKKKLVEHEVRRSCQGILLMDAWSTDQGNRSSVLVVANNMFIRLGRLGP
jgi:hypothetical protein